MRLLILFFLAASLLAMRTANAQTPAAEAAPSGTYRPVSFAKIAARIPAGTPWARIQSDDLPFQCLDDRTLTWEAEANETFQDPELERVFRAEMTGAGLVVSGDPTNLFERDEKSSDLQIGALVTSISSTFCVKHPLKDEFFSSKRLLVAGSTELTIEWQVYSTLEGRVIARFPTQGRFSTRAGIDAGNVIIIQKAFAESVHNLATNEKFRNILRSPPQAGIEKPTTITISGGRTTVRNANEARGSVAVIFAGEAMGSAFLISTDGYLLTNHHVVGDASHVRLRWADGTETVGEVVRRDPRRDVALVKADATGRAPLGLRMALPQPGDPVYAIGTPLDAKLQNTVTRGIVSANRDYEGLSFIQSDVAVTHGNSGGPLLDEQGAVIGLTDWGVAADKGSTLNFFIPIGDALKALQLTIEPAPAKAAAH